MRCLVIRKARKHAKKGDSVRLELTKIKARHDGDRYIFIECATWIGFGLEITEDGAHLTPASGNQDPALDLWLEGKNILKELNI